MNDFSLDGERAIVTGAGRGIGQAIALGLARAGASVLLAARTVEQLTQTRELIERDGGASAILELDLAGRTDFADLVDEAESELGGDIDIVVHAAGIQRRAPAEEFPGESWARVLEVNLSAPFLLSQEVGRRQLARGDRGSHVFIGSLANVVGTSNAVAYNAAKSGLMGVVRALSKEWSGRGIRVNALAPGFIETAMTEDLLADAGKRAELLGRIPMGRFGVPGDLAAPAVFLASGASAYMTGQLLIIDGGYAAA